MPPIAAALYYSIVHLHSPHVERKGKNFLLSKVRGQKGEKLVAQFCIEIIRKYCYMNYTYDHIQLTKHSTKIKKRIFWQKPTINMYDYVLKFIIVSKV